MLMHVSVCGAFIIPIFTIIKIKFSYRLSHFSWSNASLWIKKNKNNTIHITAQKYSSNGHNWYLWNFLPIYYYWNFSIDHNHYVQNNMLGYLGYKVKIFQKNKYHNLSLWVHYSELYSKKKFSVDAHLMKVRRTNDFQWNEILKVGSFSVRVDTLRICSSASITRWAAVW